MPANEANLAPAGAKSALAKRMAEAMFAEVFEMNPGAAEFVRTQIDVSNLARVLNGIRTSKEPSETLVRFVTTDDSEARKDSGGAGRYRVADAIGLGQDWADLIQLAGPRPWLIRGLLMVEAVTLLTGWGGVGKSMLSLCITIFYAMGLDYIPGWSVMPEVNGHPVKRKVLILAAEDDEKEIWRRIAAIGMLFGLDPAAAAGRIKIVTPESGADESIRIKLFTKTDSSVSRGGNAVRVSERRFELNPTELGKVLPQMIRDNDVDLVILDPIVEIHDVTENSNDEMGQVWEKIRGMARDLHIAILAIHHDSKAGSGDNVGGGRGASVNRDKVRVGLGMAPLSKEDFEKYGAGLTVDGAVMRRSAENPEAPAQLKNLFRITRGKMNYGARAEDYFFRTVEMAAGLLDAKEGKEPIGVPVPLTYTEPARDEFDLGTWEHLVEFLDIVERGEGGEGKEKRLLSTGLHGLRVAMRDRFGPAGTIGLKRADEIIKEMEKEGLIERVVADPKHPDRTQWAAVPGARAKVNNKRRASVDDEAAPF